MPSIIPANSTPADVARLRESAARYRRSAAHWATKPSEVRFYLDLARGHEEYADRVEASIAA